MTSRRRNLFVIVLTVALLFASGVVIATKDTKLGLDLKGGVELVYQGEPTPQSEVTPEAIDRAIDIIRERVDRLGVAEPEIQRLGSDQISVGLPGVKNLERAKKQVGTTAQLLLYDWERSVIGNPSSPIAGLYPAVKRASQQEPVRDENNSTTGSYYLFKPNKLLAAGPDASRKDLLSEYDGRVPKGYEVLQVPEGTVVLRAERPENLSDDAPFERYFVVRDNPEVRGTDLKDPRQEFDPTTREPIVTFRFTDKGRENFQEVTRRLAERGQTQQIPGQPVESSFQTFAIVLDREVVSRPFIDYRENPDGIDGRTGAQISGGFKLQEAQDLADVLKTGALPINLKPISETQVSASLGKQALREGLVAGLVGFGLVILFLLAFYRLLGVIASVALLMYAGLFYGLIKLIPITLTLPGIAGLILTIGIAADSNIVIFERIKEELRAGRSAMSAIATGYKRGIATIIDANVVTLITAFILFVLATAGVKGFAFTLGVGTLVSLFTAVLFTQAILGTMGRSKILRSPAMLGAGERHMTWNFDFMGKSKYFFAMSGIILIVGSLGLATKQLDFGIDFESGTRVTAALERPAGVEEVRDAVRPLGIDSAKIQNVENPEVGDNVVQISTSELGPGGVQRLERLLDREFGVEREGFSSESVGPTFGETVARSAVIAIIASLFLIMAYVAFRFEPKFAIPVMIALIHDLLITAGVYSLTGREVTTSTVAAILTILGYSLYDVVIVFDRIRENAPRMPRAAFSQIVNRSMSDVLTRSLATSMCTLMGVAALLLFGGDTLKDFAFALLVGIASGTYSSIFIAGPVLMEWKEREPTYRQRRRRIVDELGYVPAYPTARGTDEAEGEPAERPAKAPRRRRKPAPAPVGPAQPEARDEIAEELGLEHAEDGHELDLEEEAAAPVGSTSPADRSAQLRAERAERKKQRAARQSRKNRKHGRAR
ncbi:MAG TPA: protein translocase subunit SecD [Solirubrobacterales bacterium]|nr:protein translocase subunit SecD [Solirubrobacterales bacterium]